MKKKNKKFIITSVFTCSIFCLTVISIPLMSLIFQNKNNLDNAPNMPSPSPGPNPDPNPPTPDPNPMPPDPLPEPSPDPSPPTQNKHKTSLLAINERKYLEKYLVKNRIQNVKSHFDDLNSSSSLNDIWDRFNNVLFKTIYKNSFLKEVQKVVFNCSDLGNNSYLLKYSIELKNDYIFDINQNSKELSISFNYINDIPPELSPVHKDFKTFYEAFDNDPKGKIEAYNLSFPLITNLNSLGSEEKNKLLISNFIDRYSKLGLLDFLIRQEWIYQLMSFVFSNFNDSIYDWQFYTDSYLYKKINLSFNLKKDVSINEWKNNIFGSNLSQMKFSKNDRISIVVSYKDFDPTEDLEPKVSDFVKNKEWYDNNGNKKIISNSPQISLHYVSLNFIINDNNISLSKNRLTTIPYTMFWDFIDSDKTTFVRPNNSVDLDEYSFGLAPTLVKMGTNYNLELDILPIDPDIQYNKSDIKYANSIIQKGFKLFDYNWNYEYLSQLKYFVNYNFYDLFEKEETYKINNGNNLIYETQIKLNTNKRQGLHFKHFPNWINEKIDYKKDDIVKIRIEKLDNTEYSPLDNLGFYYLGYDPSIISDQFKYDKFVIRNYLDEKRFPLTKIENKKNATLSSQISGGNARLSVAVLRNGIETNIVSEKFALRTVSLATPITYCYYIKEIIL